MFGTAICTGLMQKSCCIQARRSLAQSASGAAVPPAACENKMRAVFMLRRSLGTDSIGNASSVQKTVR